MPLVTLAYEIKDSMKGTNKRMKLLLNVWIEAVWRLYQISYVFTYPCCLLPRSMISELENGRLAMLAFVVQLILEIVTKKSIVGQWEDVLAAIANAKK